MGRQISSYMNSQFITADYASVVRGSHFVTARADIYYAGKYVTQAPLISGSVTADRTANVARQGTAVIGDPTFFPTFVNSPLAPYGVELRIYSGISTAANIRWIPLGVFTLENIAAEDSTGGFPEVTFFDRSQVLARAKFVEPIDRSGWRVRDLIIDLVRDVCPQANVYFDPTVSGDARLPGGTVFETDRIGALQVACKAANADGRFGWDGNFYVVPIPSLYQTYAADSVWDFDAGSGGTLVTAKRGISRTGVANFIAVSGARSNDQTPVGYAWDDDPRSPTYWGSQTSRFPSRNQQQAATFGQNVIHLQNDLLTTDIQCQEHARAQLRNYLGLARSLQFTAVPNPALDCGDTVKVKYKDGKTEYHIVDSFTIPFGLDGQFSANTRTLTYQLTGGQ